MAPPAEIATAPPPADHRILLIPFPASGHIKPFLNLAELLSDAGLDIVFLNTEYNQRRIADLENLTTRFPTIQFETISDGLPLDQPRDIFDPELFYSILYGTKSRFLQFLQSFNSDDSSSSDDFRPITCIITDVVLSSPIDVAEELGIPVFCFTTFSARFMAIYFWMTKLMEEGQIPYTDMNSETELYGVPLSEGFLRRKDLPGFWSTELMINDQFHPITIINETMATRRVSGLIINTFDELESSFLINLCSNFKKIYTIGPIHAMVKVKSKPTPCPCITWLDSQPSRSVIFISFGTIVKIETEELIELWHGLINSGKSFLFVFRANLVSDDEGGQLIKQLLDEVGGNNGMVVESAPQEQVLNHRAVGGFLTHSGWNSVMESITAGVPMICRPIVSDQHSNATWIDNVWKIGFEIEGVFNRSTVEKKIRALMAEEQIGEKKEIQRSVEKFSKLAMEKISKDGDSSLNLIRLIEDLKKANILH